MRNDDMPHKAIFITGAARSGTSLVAGTINICGAFGGKMYPANRYNQKGMFENAEMRDNVVKDYLKKINVDPRGQYPLPDVNNLIIPDNFRGKVENIFINQGYNDGHWFYKAPKMCLFWPVWNQAFPDAKWVIVRRRTGDVINSCFKTGFMTAFQRKQIQKAVGAKNEREGWLWWIHQHENRFIEMMKEGLNVKIIWPEKMLYGNYTEIKDTIEWLGLEWKEKEVMDFITPRLWSPYNKRKIK